MVRHRSSWRGKSVSSLIGLNNFLILVSGVLLLALSIFGMTAQGQTSLYTTGLPSWTLLIAVVLLLTSGIGIYGVSKDHPRALRTYMVLVLVIFAAQVILGAVALAKVNHVGSYVYEAWADEYENKPSNIERIEHTLQCCGFSSLSDKPVPDDCSQNKRFGYVTSCREKLVPTAESTVRWTGWILLIIAIIEVFSKD